jgi:hypothetical protein
MPLPWYWLPRRLAASRPIRRPCRRTPRPLWLEALEDRVLLSGDTLTSPTQLTLTAGSPSQTQGTIATSTSQQLYAVNVASNATLTVSVAPTQNDPSPLTGGVVRVFDSSGNPILASDAVSTNPNGIVQLDTSSSGNLPGGTYYIGVSGQGNDQYNPSTAGSGSGSTTGDYTLNLDEELQTLGSPAPVALTSNTPTVLADAIDSASQTNYYAVQVNDYSTLTVSLAGTPTGGLSGGVVSLFDSSGNPLLASNALSVRSNGTLQLQTSDAWGHYPGGTYYIGVSGPGSTTGDYTLNISESDSPDEQTLATAVQVSLTDGTPTFVADSIDWTDQANLYAVQLTQGDLFSASAIGTDASQGQSIPYLRIFDSSGKQVGSSTYTTASGADGSNVYTASEQIIASASGTYYVGVSAWSNTDYDPKSYYSGSNTWYPGSYQLQLFATPTSLSGTISTPTDQNLYAVQVNNNSTLTVSLTGTAQGGQDPLSDGVVRLFDSYGNPLLASDAISTNPNGTLQLQTSSFGQFPGGIYYIGVSGQGNDQYDPFTAGSGWGSTTGGYTLNISESPSNDEQTLNTATSVALTDGTPTFVADSVDSVSQDNLYAVQLTQGELFTATASGLNPGGVFSSADLPVPYLRIFDSNGNQIGGGSDGINDYKSATRAWTASQEIVANTTGTYYVGVSASPNGSYDPNTANSGYGEYNNTGPYQLQLLASSGGDGSSITQPTIVTGLTSGTSTSVSGTISTQTDQHLYAVQVDDNSTLTVSLSGTPQGGLDSLSGGVVRLFDANGNPLLASDAISTNPNGTLQLQTSSAGGQFPGGIYYIGVSGQGNDQYNPFTANSGLGSTTGGYTLNISESPSNDEQTQASATYVSLTDGTPTFVADSVDSTNQDNFYAVTLNPGEVFSVSAIALNGSQGYSIPYLRLFDSNGNQIGTGSTWSHTVAPDGSTIWTSSQQIIDPISGTPTTFYVGVSAWENTTYSFNSPGAGYGYNVGPYQLQLLATSPPVGAAGASIGNPTPLSLTSGTPTSQPDSISTTAEQHLYAVQVADNSTLTVSLAGASRNGQMPLSNGVVRLFDSYGNPILSSDALSAQNNGTLQLETTSASGQYPGGTYYIGVSGQGNDGYDPFTANSGLGTTTGSYTLNVSETPNLGEQTLNNATIVSLADSTPTFVADATSSVTPVNSYAVQLAAGEVLSVNAIGTEESQGWSSPAVQILDSQGNPVNPGPSPSTTSGHDGSVIATSRQQIITSVAGIYYVEVSAGPNSNAGSGIFPGGYQLQLLANPAVWSLNDNTTHATAITYQPGQNITTTGYVHNPDDVAMYRVSLNQGDTVTLQADAIVPRGWTISNPPVLAPYLQVFDAQGDLVASGNTSSPADLTYTASATGTFYVVVSSAGNTGYDLTSDPYSKQYGNRLSQSGTSMGPFQLHLQVQPPVPDSMSLLTLNGTTAVQSLSAGHSTTYAIDLTQPGLLTLGVALPSGSTLDPQLALIGPANELLIDSVGQPSANVSPSINQHLDPGLYFVTVSSSTGSGSLGLTSTFAPTGTSVNSTLAPMTTADFNGDHNLDLATIDPANGQVQILYGLGDGTFAPPVNVPTNDSSSPVVIVTGHFVSDPTNNPNNLPDLAVLYSDGFISVLANQGGTFAQPVLVSTNDPYGTPVAFVAGNFVNDPTNNPNGLADMAVLNDDDSVTVLANQNGILTAQAPIDLYDPSNWLSYYDTPTALVAGQFGPGGQTDLVVGSNNWCTGSGQVTVLLGSGASAAPFTLGQTYQVGHFSDPVAMATGNFFGTANTDLAVLDYRSDAVVLLPGNGDGTFGTTSAPLSLGLDLYYLPISLTAANFNGRTDLVASSVNDHGLALLVNVGPGQGVSGTPFAPAQRLATFDSPTAVVAGDFNNDGHQDLAVADWNWGGGPTVISVLAGRGDGTFQNDTGNKVGEGPVSIVSGDFNGDGFQDTVIANQNSDSLSILLGNGDGTFQQAATMLLTVPDAATGHMMNLSPWSLTTGDFFNNGVLDLAVEGSYTDPTSGAFVTGVDVLAGKGDGTFVSVGWYDLRYALPDFSATALTWADLQNNAYPDLVVTASANDGSDGKLLVLQNEGHGSFAWGPSYNVGIDPEAVTTGDFNGDGSTDVAVANRGDDTVSVLLNDGHGGLSVSQTLQTGYLPYALTNGHFTAGSPDGLAVANFGSDNVSVYLPDGHGRLQQGVNYAVEPGPTNIVAAGFTTHNGVPVADLATANWAYGDVSLLVNDGSGHFGTDVVSGPYGNNDLFFGMTSADFNNDGHPDLALSNWGLNTVTLLQGTGNPQTPFLDPSTGFTNPFHAQPLVGDLNGDGVPDLVTLDQSGHILFREGIAGTAGGQEIFAPAIVVNPFDQGGLAAASITLYHPAGSNGPTWLAALNRQGGITFYEPNRQGGFIASTAYAQGPAPQQGGPPLQTPGAVQITAGDLTGTNPKTDPDSLVVSNGVQGSISVFLSNSHGTFVPSSVNVGNGPWAVTLAKTTSSGLNDIIVTNQVSGDVSVLLNAASNPFAQEFRVRAGSGPYGEDTTSGAPAVQSADSPIMTVAGSFTGSGATDLLTLDSGDNAFVLLPGLGNGTFLNPTLSIPTGSDPIAIATGTFGTQQNAYQGVAVLNRGTATTPATISIYRNDGNGKYSPVLDTNGQPVTYAVGDDAVGLTVASLGGSNAAADLIVSNASGDALVLTGNPDGTFVDTSSASTTNDLSVPVYQRVEHIVIIASLGNGQFVFANQGSDNLTVKSVGSSQVAKTSSGQPVLNQGWQTDTYAPTAVQSFTTADGTQYIVAAYGGANEVALFQLVGNSFKELQTLSTGLDPVGLTVTTNLNGNGLPDVIVANKGSNTVSVLFGTQSTTGNLNLTLGQRLSVGDAPVSTAVVDNSGTQDLVVSNSADNTVWVMPGRGQGYFSDLPQDVTVYNTGNSPGQVLVGNFGGSNSNELSLVTVNAGSNDLTFIANFLNPTDLSPITIYRPDGESVQMELAAGGQEISSGGITPLAAVAVSLPGQEGEGLLVANSGSGDVTLLEPGADGPQFVGSAQVLFPGTSYSQPTSVVLPTVTANADGTFTLSAYVADGGQLPTDEMAIPVSFTLALAGTGPVPVLEGEGTSIAELQPFAGGSVGIVATLVTGSIDTSLTPASESTLASIFDPSAFEPNMLGYSIGDETSALGGIGGLGGTAGTTTANMLLLNNAVVLGLGGEDALGEGGTGGDGTGDELDRELLNVPGKEYVPPTTDEDTTNPAEQPAEPPIEQTGAVTASPRQLAQGPADHADLVAGPDAEGEWATALAFSAQTGEHETEAEETSFSVVVGMVQAGQPGTLLASPLSDIADAPAEQSGSDISPTEPAPVTTSVDQERLWAVSAPESARDEAGSAAVLDTLFSSTLPAWLESLPEIPQKARPTELLLGPAAALLYFSALGQIHCEWTAPQPADTDSRPRTGEKQVP